MKDEFVKLRVSAEEREAWQQSANVAGITLSSYVRRCVDEAQALEHALNAQVEDVRQAERRREAADRHVSPRPTMSRPRPQPRQERMGVQRGWGISIGEALARADRGR